MPGLRHVAVVNQVGMQVLLLIGLFASSTAVAYDCRANISPSICLLDQSVSSSEFHRKKNIRCLEGSETFAKEIEAVHDEMPPNLRLMFCYIKHIYIFENADTSAFSYFDPSGHVIGLSKSMLFSGLSFNTWLQRKEQNAFGLSIDTPLTPKIPKLEVQMNTRARDQLLYVFLHEFGHLLDQANGLQRYWASQSWLPNGKIRASDRFANQTACFYNCLPEESWPLERANSVYQKFVQMGRFVSLYATVDSFEDFAETFAYFFGERLYGMKSAVKFANGKVERLNEKKGNRLENKFDFVRAFSKVPWEYGAHNLCALSHRESNTAESAVEGCPGRR